MIVKGTTRVAAVLGWPVEHSRSPQMLNAAFEATGVDAVMVPIAVEPEKFADVISALRAINALGASVTVPHKLVAAALCDQITPEAKDIGAVNCLQLEGGRLVGHNTDAAGFLDGLAGFEGEHCILLGAGGAARAVAYALRDKKIEVIARRPEVVSWTQALPWTSAQLHASFAAADLVVDCTPAGLDGDLDVPIETLPRRAWVASLIYHRSTALLERAKAAGHSTVDGRAMLVHQGARAFAIWTGRTAPIDVMTKALNESLAGT